MESDTYISVGFSVPSGCHLSNTLAPPVWEIKYTNTHKEKANESSIRQWIAHEKCTNNRLVRVGVKLISNQSRKDVN